ncbi:hypothetical protein B0H16DRAFT_1883529 [Mycena metata]|uniref:Uncharacterized protein n=1 Tax=Mycena metata TaxID=1033252 RepID=A0AAD7NKF8_9AGAR|nr:hypothetical protein B0H16DRAFT_1883529 [Mycena metata]
MRRIGWSPSSVSDSGPFQIFAGYIRISGVYFLATDGQIREVENLLQVGLKQLSELDDTILKLSLVLSELGSQKRRRVNSLSALKRVLAQFAASPRITG